MEHRHCCASLVASFAIVGSILAGYVESISVSNGVGINYGQIADNLPNPSEVKQLLMASNLTNVRIYDADPAVLNALHNTGIEIVISLGNEYVAKMYSHPDKALDWVKKNVQAYLPGTKITGILVGNEVYASNNTEVTESLLGALKNMHTALVQLGLDSQVKVSTAHSFEVFAASFPPSSCTFKEALVPQMKEMLSFLAAVKAPFLVNAYPYFAYKGDPANIPLNYVLFKENSGVVDERTGLHYDNMLYAQIDAAYSALANAGYGSLDLKVAETGWPSKGDENEAGATPENAKEYNGNLLQRLRKGEGTPFKPNQRLEAYIFALFNENLKQGPASERNYGLYKPDGTQSYDLGLKSLKETASSSPTSFSPVSPSVGRSIGPIASTPPKSYPSYSYAYTSSAREGIQFVLSLALILQLLGLVISSMQ